MRPLIGLLVLAFCIPAVRPALAGGRTIGLHAERVAFYSDRFLIEADGRVQLELPGDRRITGNTFSLDLRNDRMLIAGGVHVHTPHNDWDGAAYAEFFDFKRGYFLPVLGEPDRWTFVDGNFEQPVKGRIMPEDAFALPDLTADKVFMYATAAQITLKENVVFGAGRLLVGVAYSPVPSYVLNFSQNPFFGQNSLAGAYVDAPYNFAGGLKSLETLHFRYDAAHHGFLAYEQHLVSARNFAVFSINPINRPDKQFNLQLSEQIGSRLQQQTLLQLSTFQSGLSRPLAATGFGNSLTTYALAHSALRLELRQFNQSLLAPPQPDANGLIYYGDPSHNFDPTHPFQAQLAWTGIDQRLLKSPFHYTLRSGFGWYHSYIPVQTFNNVNYPTLWTEFAGISAYLPSIKIGPKWVFNLSADKQRNYYSSPHYIDTARTTASLSRTFGNKAVITTYYTVANTGDYYGGLQLLAYPSSIPTSPFDGSLHPGFAAFRGVATSRQVLQQLTLTPSPVFNVNLQFAYNKDWPAPIPFTYGNSPYQFSGSFRLRFTKTLYLDLSRSYNFNFGNQGWSPQFGFRIGT